ncbi:MAG TPA: vWA domain-containing protein [Polyangiaceae bacterium]
MRKSLGLLISFGVVGVGIACSAGKASPGGKASGGSAANGGFTLGGNGGTGATAGTSMAMGATGNVMIGTGGGAPVDAGNDGPVDAGVCDQLNVDTTEIVPTVALLVDTSGSMFQNPKPFWTPLYTALMDPTNGVVKQLEDKVRFGFTSYKGVSGMCPSLITVPYAINNYDAINAVYSTIGATYNGQKWDTPTGAALAQTATDLDAFQPVPPGPKFILLVTDGSPDTCDTPDPQCGQDASIKAVQDAYAKNIKTIPLGIGDITDPAADGCDVNAGRCGLNHLQDVANAGAGQPVEPEIPNYLNQQCVKNKMVTASYAAVGGGGMAPYYTVSGSGTTADVTPLVAAIKQALIQTRSCTFNMTVIDNGTKQGVKITADADKGMLTYNGTALTFNDPNGWTLGSDLVSVTLNGTACDSWKTNGGSLSVVFPCTVPHVEVPPPPDPK